MYTNCYVISGQLTIINGKQENTRKVQGWKKNERKKSDCRHFACGNFSSHPYRV